MLRMLDKRNFFQCGKSRGVRDKCQDARQELRKEEKGKRALSRAHAHLTFKSGLNYVHNVVSNRIEHQIAY